MTIALIAGTGGLPNHVAQTLIRDGRPPIICEMRGFPAEIDGQLTRLPFRLETLGTLLETLSLMKVTEICMVGAVRRPQIDPSAIDAATAPLVPLLQEALSSGDDRTLRAFIQLFEDRGFRIVAAHQIAQDLLPEAGVYTKAMPPDLTTDLSVALAALSEMARADMGQAMLVRDGQVLAREDDRGTDALLTDFSAPIADDPVNADILGVVIDGFSDLVAGAADWLSGQDPAEPTVLSGAGAFLFKAPKPGQTLLADMPMIGPGTALKAAEAGLSGIVIKEGGVLVLDGPQVVDILNGHDMYLWVTP